MEVQCEVRVRSGQGAGALWPETQAKPAQLARICGKPFSKGAGAHPYRRGQGAGAHPSPSSSSSSSSYCDYWNFVLDGAEPIVSQKML